MCLSVHRDIYGCSFFALSGDRAASRKYSPPSRASKSSSESGSMEYKRAEVATSFFFIAFDVLSIYTLLFEFAFRTYRINLAKWITRAIYFVACSFSHAKFISTVVPPPPSKKNCQKPTPSPLLLFVLFPCPSFISLFNSLF
jgi:hypothetical protein